MIFPIADDNTGRRSTPVVTYVLIAINVAVYFFFQATDDSFTYKFSAVPAEIVQGKDLVTPAREVENPVTNQKFRVPGLEPTPVPVYFTLITSMFMHGGIAHLLGNMLFLWIFGDNIEDDMGRLRYLIFYLVCGIVASLSHVFMNAWGDNALVPSLGASGAISGVLGAYLVLHPHRRVHVIMFRFLTTVPGYVAVGLWFLFQIISSLGVLGSGSAEGGVAYAAHIGGFIAGLVLAKPFTFGRVTAGTFGERTFP